MAVALEAVLKQAGTWLAYPLQDYAHSYPGTAKSVTARA